MSKPYHDLARVTAEAQALADANREPYCVCEMGGKFFTRPERRALSAKALGSIARIVLTCMPEMKP